MTAVEWLDKNEWPEMPIYSDAFSHHTMLSSIMEQYAREYHAKQLEKARKKEETKFKKFL
tara:strand:+ start:23090 stop:23269 length:180 start_codon:yes stop_codon:yes gene_type:complete